MKNKQNTYCRFSTRTLTAYAYIIICFISIERHRIAFIHTSKSLHKKSYVSASPHNPTCPPTVSSAIGYTSFMPNFSAQCVASWVTALRRKRSPTPLQIEVQRHAEQLLVLRLRIEVPTPRLSPSPPQSVRRLLRHVDDLAQTASRLQVQVLVPQPVQPEHAVRRQH